MQRVPLQTSFMAPFSCHLYLNPPLFLDSSLSSRLISNLYISDCDWDEEAYTVELEAELNILKEENARLRRTLAELEDMMTREVQERLRRALKRKPETRAERDAKKIKVLRRTMSGPY